MLGLLPGFVLGLLPGFVLGLLHWPGFTLGLLPLPGLLIGWPHSPGFPLGLPPVAGLWEPLAESLDCDASVDPFGSSPDDADDALPGAEAAGPATQLKTVVAPVAATAAPAVASIATTTSIAPAWRRTFKGMAGPPETCASATRNLSAAFMSGLRVAPAKRRGSAAASTPATKVAEGVGATRAA